MAPLLCREGAQKEGGQPPALPVSSSLLPPTPKLEAVEGRLTLLRE